MSAGEVIRVARATAGVSQREFAARTGAAQPAIASLESGAKDATVSRLKELLAPLSFRLAPIPSPCPAVWEVAGRVKERLSLGDDQGAFREVIQLSDDLRGSPADIRVALCVTPPMPTGRREFDALLAGLVEDLLTSAGLPVPAWVDHPSRTVDVIWDVEPVPALRAEARRSTPPAFVKRGVYVSRREFESV